MGISILILTLNEEVVLPRCLDSVKWSDDIVVFDSFSSDKTIEIAKSRNARVFQKKFEGYASQRNAALAVEFKNPWVLMVDADEQVPENLRQEACSAVESASEDMALFRMRRKDFFMGRWIKHSSGYPTWFGRLLRAGRVRVDREINEEYHATGEAGFLRAHLHHYPFTKGIQFWVERHNRYSSMEATALSTETRRPIAYSDLLAKDPAIRRKVGKQILYRLPLRPVLVPAYLFLFRGGFLDGPPGIYFSLLRAVYEYMIALKMKEIERRRLGLPL
jgi:glycosyltransferase involved in cell wall biosynthesis